MKKNLIQALEFYQQNSLDEVVSSNLVNHFENKISVIKEIKKSAAQNKIEVKKSVASNQSGAQNAVNKNEFQQKISDAPKNNSFINPVFSTSQALSNLAQRPQTSNNLNEKFMSLNAIVESAKKAAKSCKDLKELRKAVENFDGCSLKKMATNTVFSDGNPDSEIMVIGEAPGNHEDLQGIPFCGDSGKLLDAMFSAIDFVREKNLYITNVIFWRPPGNRRPTEEELAICRPFVERHIELFDPKIIVLVGATSMSAVLGINDPVTKIRGQILEYKPDFMKRTINSFVIFHPSYLMRQSAKKRIAWRDMLELEKVLQKK